VNYDARSQELKKITFLTKDSVQLAPQAT